MVCPTLNRNSLCQDDSLAVLRSNWLEGAMLIAAYVMVGLTSGLLKPGKNRWSTATSGHPATQQPVGLFLVTKLHREIWWFTRRDDCDILWYGLKMIRTRKWQFFVLLQYSPLQSFSHLLYNINKWSSGYFRNPKFFRLSYMTDICI